MPTRHAIVRNTGIPSPVASPAEANEKGHCDGRIEVLNIAGTIEISDSRSFRWGEGFRVAAGQSYYQDNKPDPTEWFGVADPAGADNLDVRVLDTRRPAVE